MKSASIYKENEEFKTEEILKNIKKYDFEKLNRCFDNPHNSTIGFWSYWWLTQCQNGYVKDSGMRIIKKDKSTTYADLNLFGSNGEFYGALEVENKSKFYETDVKNLSSYPNKFNNIRFLILHFWIEVDENGKYVQSKTLNSTIKSIKMILKDNNPAFWILVISRWGPNSDLQKKHFNGNIERENGYIGHEWLVFNNGLELTEYYGNIGKGSKINY